MKTVVEKNLFAKKKKDAHAAIDRSIGRGAYSTERIAKGYAAVDTGRLRASIETKRVGNLLWVVFTVVDYARHVEEGTIFMAAQPFMRPAYEQNFAYLIRELQKSLKSL